MMGQNRASRIVVDEGVSDEAFARAQDIWSSKRVLVREQHPGMPDGQIVSHLIDQSSIFVTTDRPLYNRVLAKRYRSYYLYGGGITGKPLHGIHQKRHTQHRETPQPIQESYLPPISDLHPLLMPLFDELAFTPTTKGRYLERLRTKSDTLAGDRNSNEIVPGELQPVRGTAGRLMGKTLPRCRGFEPVWR